MLPKENRLSKKEFKRLDRNSVKFRGEYGMVVIEKYEENTPKFGFIVSKKIGNAVQRHKMTRLLREIARENLKNVTNIKGVYIAYKYCEDYKKLEKDFTKHFRDALNSLKKS
ncbi:MAG: ribonuclease P [bacterium ADurb.Bin363]|nr:MAG: ribonuclease P [bacterium ADurb.Bin363]